MLYAVVVELDTGGLLFYGVPFAIIVGWVSGRILGVRRGWIRSFVAGLFGWVGGVVMAALVENRDIRTTGDLRGILLLAFFFGLLVSMFVSLVLDVLLRPRVRRSRSVGTVLRPITTLKRKLAPLGRSRQIFGYARKRGITGFQYASTAKMATPEFARRLRLTLEDCGGMFVKFGQIASTRNDLLPEVITTELAELQSAARPVPADEVRKVLESELGASVEEEFASFDFEPLAAASIGQTHRAVLRSGERVVVKVQRPGIEEVVQRDAAVLRLIADQLDRRVEGARQIGIKGLAGELITSLERELNYGTEATSAAAFLVNLEDEEGLTAPVVHQALSTRRILVMEEIDGVTVADRAAIEATPVTAGVLATRLLQSFLEQVLRDGLYHGDPHPGNIFVDREGILWFLDFGAVGRLDPVILEAMQEMAIGFQLKDQVVLARALLHLAGGDASTDTRALEADVGMALTDTLSGSGFGPQAMGTMLDVMRRHGLSVPTQLTVLSRALLTLEGTLRTIEPTFSISNQVNEILPAISDQKDEVVRAQLEKELVRNLPVLRTLPAHAEAIAAQLRGGRLSTRVERYAGGDRVVVDSWVDRVTFAAVGMFGLLSSAVLLLAAGLVADDQEGVRNTLQVVGFFGLVVATVIQMRVVAQVLRADTSGRDRRT